MVKRINGFNNKKNASVEATSLLRLCKTKTRRLVNISNNINIVNSNLRYAERCKEPFFFVFAWNKGILSLQEKKITKIRREKNICLKYYTLT